TNALLVTLLVPPVAIMLGALFLNETLAVQDFLGLGLIALGLAAIDGRLLNVFRLPALRPRTIIFPLSGWPRRGRRRSATLLSRWRRSGSTSAAGRPARALRTGQCPGPDRRRDF